MSIAVPRRARVLVVDGHAVTREGLHAVIDREPDMRVWASAGGAAEALRRLASGAPELAVVDYPLELGDSLSLVRALSSRRPATGVLVFSRLPAADFARRALAAGALGYLCKREPLERIPAALRRILRGEVAVDQETAGRLLRLAAMRRKALPPLLDALTDRELQVFQCIAKGLTARAAAAKLSLSVKTIETYRDNIKRKLEVKDLRDLVRRATLWSAEG